MGKVILEFDDKEDRKEMLKAVSAHNAYAALLEYKEYLRAMHREKSPIPPHNSSEDLVEILLNRFTECLYENEIDLNIIY